MDFIFFSAIATVVMSLASIFVSYDIACQWSKNINKRAEKRPGYLNASIAVPMFTFLIPKFHLPGHGSPCQAMYSFNLNIGCARTDGEGIERGWSLMNPLGTATREMGPGGRQDTLEDHWGNMNWTKTVELCEYYCAAYYNLLYLILILLYRFHYGEKNHTCYSGASAKPATI